jgi:hypothetical protein
MFLTEIFEATQPKHASFCFGRMNPPTTGHGKLISTTEQAARGGDYFVFASQTQDKKNNPLDYATKIKFLKALFPKQANHIVQDPSLNTIMAIAQWLYDKGYRTVTFVAGSDRLEAFQKLLTSYNGMEDKPVYYKFNKIDFVSSGDREDGAEGVEGVSASQARAAAIADNLDAFTQATGAGRIASQLFTAVRNGMGLTDAQIAEHFDSKPVDETIVKVGSQYELKSHTGKNLGKYPSRAGAEKREQQVNYFKHVKEDASGYIPKNKKEAKDPRWSNALTVDVHPDTPYKNAKALKLV